MAKTIISEGKTTNEAIENGLKELKVSKDMVDVKVIEEEKRSFYNILAPRVVKVELTVKENQKLEKREQEKKERRINKDEKEINGAVEEINKFLDKFLKNGVTYKTEVKDYEIYVNIEGEDVNHLIGYRGENINSLQTIITAVANKNTTLNIRIYLDIAGYRLKREKTLEDLADKIARTVIRTRKPVTLEPMTAYERKIIHTRLQTNSKVETVSKGEEPYRKVVIKLK